MHLPASTHHPLQWAGDDEEDEKKKEAQAEVSKLLTILNEDLDEEDLRNVLMECLKVGGRGLVGCLSCCLCGEVGVEESAHGISCWPHMLCWRGSRSAWDAGMPGEPLPMR